MNSTQTQGDNPPPCSSIVVNDSLSLCPDCSSLPFLTLQSNTEIKYECKCGKPIVITLDNFFNNYNNKGSTKRNDNCFNTKKHGNKISTTFCFQCQKWMCANCTEVHNEFMSEHEVTNSPVMRTRCLYHNDQKITSFCKDCQEHICPLCKDKHKKHLILDIDNLYSEDKLNQYIKDIEEAEKLINVDNKKIKDKLIDDLKKKIQVIEDLYIKHVAINQNLIRFSKVLLNEYKASKDFPNYIIYQNTNNLKINLKQIQYNQNNSIQTNINNVVNYLSSNFILSNEFDINQLQSKKLNIKYNNETLFILQLRNSNYITSDNSYKLSIYDTSYNLITSISIDEYVYYIYELVDERILTLGTKEAILWKKDKSSYVKEKEYSTYSTGAVYCALPLNNDEIIIADYYGAKIYNTNYPYTSVKTLLANPYSNSYQLKSLLLLSDGRVASSYSNTLIFFNMKKLILEKEHTLNGISIYPSQNSIREISGNKLLVGGIGNISIIDLAIHKVIKSIQDQFLHSIVSVLELTKNVIVVGNDKNELYFFDLNLKYYGKVNNGQTEKTNLIIPYQSEDGFITVGKEIYLWQY